MKNFKQKVWEIVGRIPRGKVMSYGQIAAVAGYPRNARMVGYALHAIPDSGRIPWQRVVRKDGSLADFSDDGSRQYQLLKAEGVVFTLERKVDMEQYRWEAWELEAEMIFMS